MEYSNVTFYNPNLVRLLVVDDIIPNPEFGYGYPRAFELLKLLSTSGFDVTFFPLQDSTWPEPSGTWLEQCGIRFLFANAGIESFENTFRRIFKHFNAIWISRHKNLKSVIPIVKRLAPHLTVIYDVEALTASREILLQELRGSEMSQLAKDQLLKNEFDLIRQATFVVAVSSDERSLLEMHDIKVEALIGHPISERKKTKSYEERSDILFLGGFYDFPNPNQDAVEYLILKIFPHVVSKIDCRLTIAGFGAEKLRDKIPTLCNLPFVKLVGFVPSLAQAYDKHRVFVASTRYAAGIPWKVTEAFSHGIPVVVTPLLAKQLRLKPPTALIGETEVSFADKIVELYRNREKWIEVRNSAFSYVKDQCSPEQICRHLTGLAGKCINNTLYTKG
jgi:O-antigen biosynthesis protein